MAQGSKTGGRQKGSVNKATAEVRGLALEHGPAAVAELARLSTAAESETARIQACNAVIERAYGKAVPGRPVMLNLPDTSTVEGVTKAMAAIVQAAASGVGHWDTWDRGWSAAYLAAGWLDGSPSIVA